MPMKRSLVVTLVAALLAAMPATATAGADPAPADLAAAKSMNVAPYFLVDEAGHPNRTGPFLIPVRRSVPVTVATGRASLQALLDGPTMRERNANPGISTTIPKNVELLGLTIDNGKAVVNLTMNFAADDDAAAAALRVAQVVWTITRFPTVDRVIIRQNGHKVAVQTGEGDLVERAVNRDDYLAFVAAISVESPTYRGVSQPGSLRVTGIGAVFEAVFSYRLRDHAGSVLDSGIAMTDNGSGWGEFDFTIEFDVDDRQVGTLTVLAFSAKDGSKIDVRKVPVILKP
jgi:germination protein M